MNKLPKGWKLVKFSEVVYLRHGHQFRKHDFVENGIPVIKIGQCKIDGTLDLSNCDFIDKSRLNEFKDYQICKGDLLMALTGGTLGKVTFVDKDYGKVVQNYRVGNFFPIDNQTTKEFVRYILLSDIFQNLVADKVNQGAQPNIGKDSIDNMPIPLPPLPEQKRIVSKLDALFERIDKSMALLEENIKHTENLMASALDEVFLEIDKKYWVELKTISDLITKGSSPNWQGVKYVDEPGVLFITSKNVGNHKLILGDKKTYLESKFNEIQPRSILQKDDILLNIVGASIGRTAKYDLEEVANINQAVCLIRLKKSLVNVNYALHFFNSTTCISYMFDKKVDNARANLSMGNIQKFIIPLPPLEQQNKISKKIGAILNKLELLQEEQQGKLNNLKTLKESILDKAFKGEL